MSPKLSSRKKQFLCILLNHFFFVFPIANQFLYQMSQTAKNPLKFSLGMQKNHCTHPWLRYYCSKNEREKTEKITILFTYNKASDMTQLINFTSLVYKKAFLIALKNFENSKYMYQFIFFVPFEMVNVNLIQY